MKTIASLIDSGMVKSNKNMATSVLSQMTLSARLADWLCRRLDIFKVARETFAPGYVIGMKVVPSDRLILILNGGIQYEVEKETYAFDKGCELYISGWVRRNWKASPQHGCEIFWVEFSPSAPASGHSVPLFFPGADLSMEEASVNRLLELWTQVDQSPFAPLVMEGELKALLARFMANCRNASPGKPAERQTACEQEVEMFVGYLNAHFASPKVLHEAMERVTLSANYFRRLFRQQTGMTVAAYLAQLRLRQARYYLRETSIPVKEVACRAGYNDPLRFSKLYHHFWGHAPQMERVQSCSGRY